MEARLKNMEVERLKMNTFLKESGYVRYPVAEDGDCCYLAILGSLGVLPPGEVAPRSCVAEGSPRSRVAEDEFLSACSNV
jgi:hypothetical protein